MTKTILVPLDGSDRAEAAVVPANWLAAELGVDLHLITSSFAADRTAEEAMLARALAHTKGSGVSTEVLDGEFPVRAILDTADELPDAVICMSTHGRGGLREAILGSVADEVLRNAEVPVVLVGPGFDPGAGNAQELVLCVDETPESMGVLPVATDWARALGLTTHVVTVTDGHEPSVAAEEARGLAEDAALALQAHGVQTVVHDLVSADVEGAILDLVRSQDARLLAIASHGWFGVLDKALGHIGTALVRECPCPVLVQRVPELGS